jgi:hypothetical protein
VKKKRKTPKSTKEGVQKKVYNGVIESVGYSPLVGLSCLAGARLLPRSCCPALFGSNIVLLLPLWILEVNVSFERYKYSGLF